MENNSKEFIQQAPPSLLTVSQFCIKHVFITQGGLRFQIFNAGNNGLASSGAIVRMGRKVLIDESRYFEWVESLREKKVVS
ncbi:MAG: hypothetical protein ACJZ45_02870 [Nitrospinia bacterium]